MEMNKEKIIQITESDAKEICIALDKAVNTIHNMNPKNKTAEQLNSFALCSKWRGKIAKLIFSNNSDSTSKNIEYNNKYSFLNKHPHFIFCLFAAVILLIALLDMPYEYYKFLNIAVFVISLLITAAFTFSFLISVFKPVFLLLFGSIVIIFNPINRLDLEDETWQIIDITSAIIFLITGIFIKYQNDKATYCISDHTLADH